MLSLRKRPAKACLTACVLALTVAACASPEGSGLDQSVGGQTNQEAPASNPSTDESTTTSEVTTTTIGPEAGTVEAPSTEPPLGTAALDFWSNGVMAIGTDGSFAFQSVLNGLQLDDPQYAATYDAAALRSEAISVDNDGSALAIVWTGLLQGGPDNPDAFTQGLFADLSAAAEGAMSDSKTITDASTGDQLTVTTDPRTGLLVTVHKPSGLPLLYESSDSEAAVREFDVSYLEQVPRSRLEIVGLTATDPIVRDAGFIVSTLDEAEKLAGYSVPVPGVVPDGFELDQVAFAASPVTAIAGSERVVALIYRSEGHQLTVTYRPSASLKDANTDPWDSGPDVESVPGESKVGFFTVVPPLIHEAHAWGEADGLFVTVSGAVSSQVIADVAASIP